MDLKIRKMEERDLEPLYKLLSDEETMKYIEPPYTREQTEEFLKNYGLDEEPFIYTAENENGDFVGYVIYHDYEEDSMELGWLILREFWGRGYATRLTEMMIELARKSGKDAVIECDPEQEVTKKIARKFGFEYQGIEDECEVYRLKLR